MTSYTLDFIHSSCFFFSSFLFFECQRIFVVGIQWHKIFESLNFQFLCCTPVSRFFRQYKQKNKNKNKKSPSQPQCRQSLGWVQQICPWNWGKRRMHMWLIIGGAIEFGQSLCHRCDRPSNSAFEGYSSLIWTANKTGHLCLCLDQRVVPQSCPCW